MTASILGLKRLHAFFKRALSIFVNFTSVAVRRDVTLGCLVLLTPLSTALRAQ